MENKYAVCKEVVNQLLEKFTKEELEKDESILPDTYFKEYCNLLKEEVLLPLLKRLSFDNDITPVKLVKVYKLNSMNYNWDTHPLILRLLCNDGKEHTAYLYLDLDILNYLEELNNCEDDYGWVDWDKWNQISEATKKIIIKLYNGFVLEKKTASSANYYWVNPNTGDEEELEEELQLIPYFLPCSSCEMLDKDKKVVDYYSTNRKYVRRSYSPRIDFYELGAPGWEKINNGSI